MVAFSLKLFSSLYSFNFEPLRFRTSISKEKLIILIFEIIFLFLYPIKFRFSIFDIYSQFFLFTFCFLKLTTGAHYFSVKLFN
ncbi:MAG: hypothetical protein A2V67_07915 [Deltaproteobacteria bacterium RBG_13_61_14]|nr:MAG: hypothetical protein A2V67_07915 [Deltaproteobacteria bacterium RBG_13_61_14]